MPCIIKWLSFTQINGTGRCIRPHTTDFQLNPQRSFIIVVNFPPNHPLSIGVYIYIYNIIQ
jgi:hypothetical protein